MLGTWLRVCRPRLARGVCRTAPRAVAPNVNDLKFPDLTEGAFERLSEETLQRLNDAFDELADKVDIATDYDVSYSMGVLTVSVSDLVGTYVINKQTPNKQIWLSSPLSGPQRYDYLRDHKWIYKHTGVSLHALLESEFARIFGQKHLGIRGLENEN